jgi:mannose-6-phosphate isomerase
LTNIKRLENVIQEYAWGSKTFIPEFMGEPSPSKKPQAELWMGTHPKAPSRVIIQGKRIPLSEIIARDPEGMLGLWAAKKFCNRLPFLFKVLAAARPLSIQAHPDKEQARDGFARENSKGIAFNNPVRNYRDENHKPELICALKPLWALKGFRRVEDIVRIMDIIGAQANDLGIDILRNQPNREGLKTFFKSLITMKEGRKVNLLDGIINRVKDLHEKDPVFEWIERLHAFYPGDVGVISPILLNLVQIKPGEAMYIPSGELHAYLEGAGLEIMANSDNVIRGGLTPKHIDSKELIHILNFDSGDPYILNPGEREEGEIFYPEMSEEFMLSRIYLDGEGELYQSSHERGAEILICVDGEAIVTEKGDDELLKLKKGESIFIPAKAEQYLIRGKFTLYKASIPIT